MSKVLRLGDCFYLYIPEHGRKYFRGKIIKYKEERVFVLHFKDPSRHLLIKNHGYSINLELLRELQRIKISHIIIPEDGKTRFQAYISEVSQYLNGEPVRDWDEQRCIDLKLLQKIDLEKDRLKEILGYVR